MTTPQERYVAAAHAMQTGVAYDMGTDPDPSRGATTPKHLRVGVNSALSDMGALARLLIGKGIITQDEYFEAVATAMEEEAQRYQKLISDRLGQKVTLR